MKNTTDFNCKPMTVKQVAEYLQMEEHAVYRLARAAKIPAFKITGQWRFKKDLIDKWLEVGSMNSEPLKPGRDKNSEVSNYMLWIQELRNMPSAKLISLADSERKKYLGGKLDICSITNAKSGACTGDCKFCSQSKKYNTDIQDYPLKSKKEMVEEAQRAKDIGAERFGIVTSGIKLSIRDINIIAETINEINTNVGIGTCASLGVLDEKTAVVLKEAGLKRYHHNLETSPEYFPHIVSTHKFESKLKTLKTARNAGLEICSGGIIGIGETEEDRIRMALVLRDLDVDSVPINILVPIKGTPLADIDPITISEVIRTIALFRLILKNKTIKIAAGRESFLKDFQGSGFMAGANGMLIGGYLTVKGRKVSDDHKFIEELKQIWNA